MSYYDKLLTIIVPVYNVEKYIGKCINSLISQSYSNLEIILINDGSTDKSGDICEEFANKDRRIKVIHKRNEGQSVARNLGLKIAKGDLIGFVDSDDYIDFNMYEILYKAMDEHNADVVECSVEKVYVDRVEKVESNKVFILDGMKALEEHLSKGDFVPKPRAAVWARLHKKSIIEGLEFPEGKIHEDFYFTYRTLLNTKKYCWIDKCLYIHIYTNVSSTTALPFNKKDFAKIDIFQERMNYLKKRKYLGLGKQAEIQFYELLLHYFYKSSFAGMDFEANQIKKKLILNNDKIKSLNFDRKKKIEFLLMLNVPSLYLMSRKGMEWFKNNRKS